MDDPRALDRPPRLTARGVLIFIAAHAAVATVYTVILTFHEPREFVRFFARSQLDDGLKAILTLPVWWIVIRQLDRRPWSLRLAAHGVLLPLYAWLWHDAYHWSVSLTGARPIYLPADKWHVFLCVVIYTAQFAIMHLIREQALVRRREELAAELQNLATRAELTALRGEVLPHFLFNALHSLSAAVPRELEGVRSRIAKLGELLRYTLRAADSELVTLADELRFAEDYLELEQARLGDRLELEFEVDQGALAAMLPPVMLQPLLENALKHGIESDRDGGRVLLSIRRRGDTAVVVVRDETAGPRGSAPRRGAGLGLNSCLARLRSVLGREARLTTRALERGFAAEMVLPLPS